MIMINKEQVSFRGNEIEIQAEFTMLCRKMREILKEEHGRENAEKMFSLMIETSAKTDEEIKEETKKMEEQLKTHPFMNAIVDAFAKSYKSGGFKKD